MSAVAILDHPHPYLRVTELQDLERTAGLHQVSLPDGFFVSLGPRFLRAYHRTFLTSPAGVALVAEQDGVVVGFVLGTIDEATHYRHVVLADRWSLGLRGGAALVCHPGLARRFAQTRLYRYGRGMVRLTRLRPAGDPDLATGLRSGVLCHMAVDEACRHQGLGSMLLGAFCDTAVAQGTNRLRLSTAMSNRSAQDFYEANGWSRGALTADADGKTWRHYTLSRP